MAPAMNRFESVVILDSGKTYLKHRCHIIMFESVVILDRFSKRGGRTFGGFCLLFSASQGKRGLKLAAGAVGYGYYWSLP